MVLVTKDNDRLLITSIPTSNEKYVKGEIVKADIIHSFVPQNRKNIQQKEWSGLQDNNTQIISTSQELESLLSDNDKLPALIDKEVPIIHARIIEQADNILQDVQYYKSLTIGNQQANTKLSQVERQVKGIMTLPLVIVDSKGNAVPLTTQGLKTLLLHIANLELHRLGKSLMLPPAFILLESCINTPFILTSVKITL